MFKIVFARLCFLLSVFFCLIEGRSFASQMHVILVVDTYAQNVELAMECNYYLWLFEIRDISRYSGLKTKFYLYKDEKANTGFLKELEKLQVDQDDVVLFYWSGHGFRTDVKDKMDNPWPSFSFEKDPKGVDFLHLTQGLLKKNPRLLISVADTCNNYIPHIFVPSHAKKGMISLDKTLRTEWNYKRLFREASGLVMCASSEPGQKSWAYDLGSLFTISFLKSISDEVRHMDDVTWNSICLKTIENLEMLESDELQVPMFLIK